jgi:hypothetical protein
MFVLFNYGLFHDFVSSRDYIGPDSKVTNECRIRKDLEGSGRRLFEILSRRLSEHTEEDYKCPYILSIPQPRFELNTSRIKVRSIIAWFHAVVLN